MEKWRKDRQRDRQRDRQIDRKKKEQESAEAISGLKSNSFGQKQEIFKIE